MRWPCFSAVALAASMAGATAQQPPHELLQSEDPVDVELARRRLVAAPKDSLPIELLRDVAANGRFVARTAVMTVFDHHGVRVEGLAALLAAERSSATRAAAVPMFDVAGCREAIEDDESDLVALAALRELASRGAIDDDVYRAALERGAGETPRAAAEMLVGNEVRLPFHVLDAVRRHAGAVEALCRAFAAHPRIEAVPWLTKVASTTEDPTARMLVYGAFPPGTLSLDQGQDIIAAAEGGARFVREAAERLPSRVADELVSRVHRLLLGEFDLSRALDALAATSELGERHLLSLARQSNVGHVEAILAWLAQRESPVVGELVGDVLREGNIVEPFIVRRAGPHLGDSRIRERVIGLLQSESKELSVAAFLSLTRGEVYDERMLDHALDAGVEPRVSGSRVRTLLTLPAARIPADAWRRLLASENPHAQVWTMQALFRDPALVFDLEPELARLAGTASKVGISAARLLAKRGRSGAITEVFPAHDAKTRRAIVTAFRDRKEPWVLELLRSDPARDAVEFRATLVSVGDADELRALFEDPGTWSRTWLRRVEDSIVASLTPDHVERLRPRLAGPDRVEGRVRMEVVGWLVKRPDLPVGPLLEEIYREDPDGEVRERALEGLLAFPEGEPVIRQVEAAIGAPMDEETDDLMLTVVGAVSQRMDPRAASLVGKLLFVAPLADPRAEIALHLELERGSAAPGSVLANIALQSVRDGYSDESAAALRAALAEARAHPAAYALGRARLACVLLHVVRDDRAREQLGAALADAIIASRDTAPEFLGPAWMVRAEAAERAGEFDRAAVAFERAAIHGRCTPPEPSTRREFYRIGDPCAGDVPDAWLSARPFVCRAKSALAAGDTDTARDRLRAAAVLARGDRDAESEIQTLLEEVPE